MTSSCINMVGTMVTDYGVGQAFSGKALETVSGGQMIKCMSINSTDLGIMLCNAGGDDMLVTGIATNNAASGANVAVNVTGIWKLKASEAITAGDLVGGYMAITTADAVKKWAEPGLIATTTSGLAAIIGKALDTVASGADVKVRLGLW